MFTDFCRERKLNPNVLFLKLFGCPRDIPAKSRDIPPKKFDFPGFEGRIGLFGPPPVHVEDPHPTRKYPDQKVWVWVPFSSLILFFFFLLLVDTEFPYRLFSLILCRGESVEARWFWRHPDSRY